MRGIVLIGGCCALLACPRSPPQASPTPPTDEACPEPAEVEAEDEASILFMYVAARSADADCDIDEGGWEASIRGGGTFWHPELEDCARVIERRASEWIRQQLGVSPVPESGAGRTQIVFSTDGPGFYEILYRMNPSQDTAYVMLRHSRDQTNLAPPPEELEPLAEILSEAMACQ